jgi:hypothetical protein
MKKDSNLPIIIVILLFGVSLSMFATMYHCPEWLYQLPHALTGAFVIVAFILLVASILIFIEITDF